MSDSRVTHDRPFRILAVASGGGHWAQLMRIKPALEGYDVVYATVDPANRRDVAGCPFHTIPDGNLSTKLALLVVALRLWVLVRRVRPQVVISTGAAPGYFALRFASRLGARSLWLDSIANAGTLSVSGRHVRSCTDAWLTQWRQLETPTGPFYEGRIL